MQPMGAGIQASPMGQAFMSPNDMSMMSMETQGPEMGGADIMGSRMLNEYQSEI